MPAMAGVLSSLHWRRRGLRAFVGKGTGMILPRLLHFGLPLLWFAGYPASPVLGQDRWTALPGGGSRDTVSAPAVASPTRVGDPLDADALRAFCRNAIASRLSVGLRWTSFSLSETQRPPDEDRLQTFIGYINELQEQDATALRPVVTYRLSDYIALEFTWDEVRARTLNFNSGTSDGVVRMGGPIASVTAQYPFLGYICPYVGIGYAPWSASFDQDAWWGLGWRTPQEYEAAGSPPNTKGIQPRHMEVDDDSAIAYSMGIAIRLHRRVDADVLIRRMSLTSKAHFSRGDPLVFESEGSFPLDHSMVGIGVHGVF